MTINLPCPPAPYLQHCGESLPLLKALAGEAGAGRRRGLEEATATRLRLLYRDCAKPPAPPARAAKRPAKGW